MVFVATAGIDGCAMGIQNSGEHNWESDAASRNEPGSENGVESREHESEDEAQDNVQAGKPGGGEASGDLLTLDEPYDAVRQGTRLIMGTMPQTTHSWALWWKTLSARPCHRCGWKCPLIVNVHAVRSVSIA